MKTHRLRWLVASFDEQRLHRLSERLLADQYSVNQAEGFRIHEVRRQFVEGLFIERREYQETVQGPDGEKTELHRLEYNKTHFRLMTSLPNVELIDPPRLSKSFLMRIAKHTDYSVSISNVDVSVERWFVNFENAVGKTQVQYIEVSAIETGFAISARLASSSNDTDIFQTIQKTLGNRNYLIRRMGFSFPIAGANCYCEIFQSGGALVKFDRMNSILPTLREALGATIPRNVATSPTFSRTVE